LSFIRFPAIRTFVSFPLQQMSIRERAELEMQFGTRIIERKGHYWRRVRPFFYRPLHCLEPMEERTVVPPCQWPGAYQYAMSDTSRANSTLNFIMLDNLAEYSLESLSRRHRHAIKQASRRFEVRRIGDLDELKADGYKAYCSFFERTRYAYQSDRVAQEKFARWAETLFCNPKAILLGGYGPTGLIAVSCSYWLMETLVYTTSYAGSEALRQNAGEAMYHGLRILAAGQPGIREILLRPARKGGSIDQYYLLRGAKLVRKPARLELSRFGHVLLKKFRPTEYSLLTGAA